MPSKYKNRYINAKPILSKESMEDNILKLHISQLNKKPVVKKILDRKKLDGDGWFNMKTDNISHKYEEYLYKIINRDVLLGNELKKVELGKVFKIGVVKEDKKHKK